ncbi:MAG: phosphotransferase [Bacteroidales bacterium]|nr:phosphotransferase [Bacteroidales bacterium]
MNIEEQLSLLFQRTFNEKPERVVRLPESGSNRLYFRIHGKSESVIGVYNNDRKENDAFLSFTRTFESLNLPVPAIIAEDREANCYILSNLGDQTLFSFLVSMRQDRSDFPDAVTDLYEQVLNVLPNFQINGGRAIDYSKCYPRNAFDRQSMLWDLNYFKYYFLKLAHVPFDEQLLEEDFQTFASFLLEADADFFMYRDFQSRNIMLVENRPCFIDYQGGRKGPLQYDVASLLYDAKADLPDGIREHLLGFYLEVLEQYIPGKRSDFLHYFPGFILIRILQALGAYGYRGFYEKKSHFLQSIPYALNNLQNLRKLWIEKRFGTELPTLFNLLDHLILDPGFLMQDGDTRNPNRSEAEPGEAKSETRTGAKRSSAEPNLKPRSLTVTINSFSYKKGIPADPSENGGGFVFDCRALPNPGRYDAYKQLTGKDQPVIDFLKQEPEVDLFLDHVTSLVDQSVSNYLERGFNHLMVNFGCTGGQHRSVYSAERLKEHLLENVEINVNLNHTNLP